uniref:C2HC/C3H-type domain-containing protein n=1 Tax=Oncorhynchus mykiss TaxID=8022 RepID=A0A8C7TAP9_ONCMY
TQTAEGFADNACLQLIPCRICHRKFAAERLEKHLQVCERMQRSSRKVFDSSKYRAKGTDLEEFMKTNSRTKSPEVRKSNWRQKHEAFIRNLRQAHVPATGALHPQPPIQDNDDYVTCPHCARRFAPGPAERHIPKCQNIKSRPPPPPIQYQILPNKIDRLQKGSKKMKTNENNWWILKHNKKKYILLCL